MMLKDLAAEKIKLMNPLNQLDRQPEKKGMNKLVLISAISLSLLSVAGGSFYFIRRRNQKTEK